MGSILGGIAAALVVAVIAGYLLNEEQQPAWQVYSSEQSARVDDPGENLVGPAWTGETAPDGQGGDAAR